MPFFAQSQGPMKLRPPTPCGEHPAFTGNCSSWGLRSRHRRWLDICLGHVTNHLAQTAAIDFFTIPMATFRVLFVFVVRSHERRRVVHFGVTDHPTRSGLCSRCGNIGGFDSASSEAFPWNQAPRYVLRDRDATYGQDFAGMMNGMGMEEVMSAPRSPWQNPYVERIVGSIRRECLDHVIVGNSQGAKGPSCFVISLAINGRQGRLIKNARQSARPEPEDLQEEEDGSDWLVWSRCW